MPRCKINRCRHTEVRATHIVATGSSFYFFFAPVLEIKPRVYKTYTNILPLTHLPSPVFTFYYETGQDLIELVVMTLNLLCIPKADLKLVIFLSQPSHSLDSQVCPRSVILLSFVGPNSMDDQLVFVEFNFCEIIAVSPASHDAPVPNV